MTNSNTIQEIKKKYLEKIDPLDLDLIVAHVIQKSREFVLTHPELEINANQKKEIEKLAKRRFQHEPLAYILGHKEFFGLDFLVNKKTLIPRPETELIIEHGTHNIKQELKEKKCSKIFVIDVGTGSGNIIISLAKNIENKNIKFFGIDISQKALRVAKENSRRHGVNRKIKFLQGNFLEPIIKNTSYHIPNTSYYIVANLPYLSKEIYNSCQDNVKKFEPKKALFSKKEGLDHYEKLLKQIKEIKEKFPDNAYSILIEFSPEQKTSLDKLIKKTFPQAQIKFEKDLANKWRFGQIEI